MPMRVRVNEVRDDQKISSVPTCCTTGVISDKLDLSLSTCHQRVGPDETLFAQQTGTYTVVFKIIAVQHD